MPAAGTATGRRVRAGGGRPRALMQTIRRGAILGWRSRRSRGRHRSIAVVGATGRHYTLGPTDNPRLLENRYGELRTLLDAVADEGGGRHALVLGDARTGRTSPMQEAGRRLRAVGRPSSSTCVSTSVTRARDWQRRRRRIRIAADVRDDDPPGRRGASAADPVHVGAPRQGAPNSGRVAERTRAAGRAKDGDGARGS